MIGFGKWPRETIHFWVRAVSFREGICLNCGKSKIDRKHSEFLVGFEWTEKAGVRVKANLSSCLSVRMCIKYTRTIEIVELEFFFEGTASFVSINLTMKHLRMQVSHPYEFEPSLAKKTQV